MSSSLLTQRWSGFYQKTQAERVAFLKEACGLTPAECQFLQRSGGEVEAQALDHWIENGIGFFALPLGIALHFVIDGVPTLIPMAVEETSVIAAASSAAKWIQTQGGALTTSTLGRLIVGQIQFPCLQGQLGKVLSQIQEATPRLLEEANAAFPQMKARGGGVERIEARVLERPNGGSMLILHVLGNPCDAMGANWITQVCELLKPRLEALTQETIGLCILSNLVETRRFQAQIDLPGVSPELAEALEEASLFAELDPYRAATHNKGLFNGMDALLLATGNDWRAFEAGGHAYAATSSPRYGPLAVWKRESSTSLRGLLELPVSLGVVGGLTQSHPMAGLSLKILGHPSAERLSQILVAVGLVQNLAALRALVGEGLVQGHLRLHASNLALAAGAQGKEIPQVTEALRAVLKAGGVLSTDRAKEILRRIRHVAPTPLENGFLPQ